MSASPLDDDAIYAFNPKPDAPVPQALVSPSARPRRRRWPWVLLVIALLALASAMGLALLLFGLLDAAQDQIVVTINGERWQPLVAGSHGWWIAVTGVAMAALVVAIVVPLAVLLALLGSALGVGIALLAVALVTALVLSPLWLIVLLLWLALRRRPGAVPAHANPGSATATPSNAV